MAGYLALDHDHGQPDELLRGSKRKPLVFEADEQAAMHGLHYIHRIHRPAHRAAEPAANATQHRLFVAANKLPGRRVISPADAGEQIQKVVIRLGRGRLG
jgi:hypothetical protein